MFIAQLNHPEILALRSGLASARIMAGAPCPIEVMKEVAATMHMSEITIAYGMTRNQPVSFQSSRDEFAGASCFDGRTDPAASRGQDRRP